MNEPSQQLDVPQKAIETSRIQFDANFISKTTIVYLSDRASTALFRALVFFISPGQNHPDLDRARVLGSSERSKCPLCRSARREKTRMTYYVYVAFYSGSRVAHSFVLIVYFFPLERQSRQARTQFSFLSFVRQFTLARKKGIMRMSESVRSMIKSSLCRVSEFEESENVKRGETVHAPCIEERMRE